MKWFPCLVLLVGICTAARAAEDESAPRELRRLQGTWTIVSVEQSGKPIAKWTEGQRIMKDDTYILRARDGSEVKGRFTVNSQKSPAVMDMTPSGGQFKGKTLRGIYQLEGDTLKICFAASGKERPTSFTSTADSGWTLAIHKRQP